MKKLAFYPIHLWIYIPTIYGTMNIMLDAVREQILRIGISDVAKMSGVAASRVGDFTHGRRALTSTNLERVLRALGVELIVPGQSLAHILKKADPKKLGDIEALVKIAVELYQPKKILLFGSQAQGHWTPASDIDLMVVGPTTDATEGKIYVRGLKSKIRSKFDSILIDEETFNRMSAGSESVFAKAAREGIVLYER